MREYSYESYLYLLKYNVKDEWRIRRVKYEGCARKGIVTRSLEILA